MVDTYELREKLSTFDKKQLYLIMANVTRIQMNTNCSIGCSDCGLGAEPMILEGMPREGYAIPWDYFKELIDAHKTKWDGQGVALYWRSEPFDYSSQGKNFLDAYDYFTENVATSIKYLLQTAVPKGSEELVLSALDRVSNINITNHKNRLSEFINVIRSKHSTHQHILTEGDRYKLGPKNIDNLSLDPISCDNGVLLTPTGVYSYHTVRPSEEFPYGYDLWEVTPRDFRIAASSFGIHGINGQCSPDLRDKYNEKWLKEGFHEIHSFDDALFESFRRYFTVRFNIQAAIESNQEGFKGVMKHMLDNALDLESRMSRDFHNLEKILIAEMKELVK